MFRNFVEIEEFILSQGIKKIDVCCAHDEAALGAVAMARKKNVADAVLVGNGEEIERILKSMGENPADYEIVNTLSDISASMTTAKLVQEGKADAEMKGLISSAEFLLPIMNPMGDLVEPDSLISQAGAYVYTEQNRMLFVADCAINLYPTLEEKAKILKNTVSLAKACGIERVRVATISALEKMNPSIPNSVDAAKLAEMDWGDDVIVAGPYALDNALDSEVARHKGIEGEVAGKADVLLMPDICVGNVFHKCSHYFGHIQSTGIICGTKKPIVFNSRSDSDETKYNSILLAIILGMYNDRQ